MHSPENIPQTEENIPLLADIAVRNAYRDALQAGRSVLTVRDDMLIKVFPSGAVRELRQLEPGTKVEPGQSVHLQ